MAYSLFRDSDGAGDSGPMSVNGRRKPGTIDLEWSVNGTPPEVGWAVRVGCMGSRTYAAQDYWTTTYVTEIISDVTSEDPDASFIRLIRFKTGNSTYTWKEF